MGGYIVTPPCKIGLSVVDAVVVVVAVVIVFVVVVVFDVVFW